MVELGKEETILHKNDLPPEVSRFQTSHKTPILDNNERRTRLVVMITLITMFVELAVGYWTNSMALTADGWHMGSHAGAMALSLFGYAFARKYDDDPRFSFGTGKVFALTGFASAVALGAAGIAVALESVHHMIEPEAISFNTAIWVTVVGLVINLICAFILGSDQATEEGGHHGHSHAHSHGHEHGGEDLNLKGAYLHVLADALTSLLAIVALVLGKFFGWVILDPLIGIVGGIVICRWALQLLKDTSWVLLDAQDDTELTANICDRLTLEGKVWVVDLHLWDLGLGRKACLVSLVDREPKAVQYYKEQLKEVGSFFHITVEVVEYGTDAHYDGYHNAENAGHSHAHSHHHSHGHQGH